LEIVKQIQDLAEALFAMNIDALGVHNAMEIAYARATNKYTPEPDWSGCSMCGKERGKHER